MNNHGSNGAGHPVHSIHPYFAKFPPALPGAFIQEFTEPGDVILDPFCGSGTTLVEATLNRRNAVGIDANPMACFISRVKTTPISHARLLDLLPVVLGIEADINRHYGIKGLFDSPVEQLEPDVPEFHNRDYWFTEHAQQELGIIKAHLARIPDGDLRDLGLLCFSRTIVFASNQQTESRYRRVLKRRKPMDIFRQFSRAVAETIQIVEDYSKRRNHVSVAIINADSRVPELLPRGAIDLIVTSPPYLNSWDYALYHRFRFFWLGMSIAKFENVEIGKHLRALEGRSKTDEVQRYAVDMGLCLAQFAKALKPSKYCVIVNANSIMQGRFVDTSQIIVDQAARQGLNLVRSVDRQVYGPHYGMHASLTQKKIKVENAQFKESEGKIAKKEQILVFSKS